MRALLLKDLRLPGPWIWLIGPLHALWCVQVFLVPDLYFWMSLTAALAWTAAIAFADWHFGADRLLASLPVSRATIVEARYVSAVGALAAGAVLYVAYGHLVVAVAADGVVDRWHGNLSWMGAGGATAFFLTGYLLLLGFLPFFFRFGLPLGGSLFLVAAAAGVAAAAAIGPVCGFGPLDGTARSVIEGMPWAARVQLCLSSLAADWGVTGATVAVTAAALVAGACSRSLSVRFFEGREL